MAAAKALLRHASATLLGFDSVVAFVMGEASAPIVPSCALSQPTMQS